MNINSLYNRRKCGEQWNTSYPLHPKDWSHYAVSSNLSFEEEKELSFYIHVPFCKQLCSFCEYTRTYCPNEESQTIYLNALLNDIERFKSSKKPFNLIGFDIGGGTPTALSEKCFEQLMKLYSSAIQGLKLTSDFEPSIEGTFQTASEAKLKMIATSGIKRISFGVQSSIPSITSIAKRNASDLSLMELVFNKSRNAGLKKINLDFMYGLRNQTIQSLRQDINLIKHLKPEQVTLYELRTNMINETTHINADQRYEMYCYYYDELTEMGYYAPFGQNTFTSNKADMGLSSYIRHRMVDCAPYKGFGISAQSMNHKGLSYNIGKNSSSLNDLILRNSFAEEHTYILPQSEIASKYLAIAAYSGAFSLTKLSQILDSDANEVFKTQIEFCLRNKLLSFEGETLRITREGFKYYGAVFSLFYKPTTE